MAGSLPFFLQATAARWLHYKRQGEPLTTAAARRQLTAELSPFFEQWWRNFEAGQREVLRCVANQMATEVVPYSALEIEEAIRRLGNYGLLREEEGQLAINGALLGRWICEFSQGVESRLKEGAATGETADGTSLRQALIDYFSLDELRTLCFDLGVDFEELPGTSKGAKARDLVQYWRNRRDLNRLVEAIRHERGAIV